MIASRSFAMNLAGGAGRSAIDVPVAALAGLSVAFLAFAAPDEMLAVLVDATGLSALLAAAEPPLGIKARVGIGGAAAILVFAAALLLLRWLDGLGRPGRKTARRAESASETLRLRRRDSHPDAPARAPLRARELGPGDDAPQAEAAPLRRKRPIVLGEATDPIPAPDPVGDDAPLELDCPAEPEYSVPPSWLSTPPPPQPADLVEPEAEAGPRSSIDELMARLEQGLARRRTGGPGTPIADPIVPDAGDDRLQNAIDSLQRFTSQAD